MLLQSARKEIESNKNLTDMEEIAELIITGKGALSQILDKVR